MFTADSPEFQTTKAILHDTLLRSDSCRCFYTIEQILKRVRLPILIGDKDGDSYTKPIKNYKHKYLITSRIFPNNLDDTKQIDEYYADSLNYLKNMGRTVGS